MDYKQQVIADELRDTMVEVLRLPIKPEEINYDTPLVGEGLGLDSVDILELVITIEQEYGIELTIEQKEYFASLDTLSSYILSVLESRADAV